MSPFQSDYDQARMDHCVPKTLCHWDTMAKMCVGNDNVFPELTKAERNTTCSYAGKDIDCPAGGCVGFSVTLPADFVASDQMTASRRVPAKTLAMCFPKDANWNVMPMPVPGCFPKDANWNVMPMPVPGGFPKDASWNVMPMLVPSGLVGTCVSAPIDKTGDFCRSAPAMVRFPAPQGRRQQRGGPALLQPQAPGVNVCGPRGRRWHFQWLVENAVDQILSMLRSGVGVTPIGNVH
jgi:hypothetical protein